MDNLARKTGTTAAVALFGMLTPPERGEVLERLRLGDAAIVYVLPEQLRNASFRAILETREIGCWVFDEAHCPSKWGHNFRPDYLYAGRFIIPRACDLLEGRAEIPGIAPDALRDRLLSGYRHIRVDEYQDIDAKQYRLISALAGRTREEGNGESLG